jgi:hypothetical protein
MYLLVVKTTGEVIVAKPDSPKPMWGIKEADGSFFEIVHMDDEQFRLGANNAQVGMPAKDDCNSGETVLNQLNDSNTACPCMLYPFRVTKSVVADGVTQKIERSRSGVKIDLTAVTKVESDGAKLVTNIGVKPNFEIGSVVIDRKI